MLTFFETTEEYARRKVCDAMDAIRYTKCREHTKKEIDDYLLT
jgi:hypothetical protein